MAVEGGGSNGPHLGNVSGGGVGALGSGISGICSVQYQRPSWFSPARCIHRCAFPVRRPGGRSMMASQRCPCKSQNQT
jgi:hypothetical protein